MSDNALRRDHSAVAAMMSVLFAAVSALIFVSHIVMFLFPIMPIGAWLGWEGRNSRYRALGWVGFVVCAALSAYLLFILALVAGESL